MHYLSALQSLATRVHRSVDPTRQRNKAGQRRWNDAVRPRLVAGELHRRRHLVYGDPLDLAHPQSYLGGRIIGAKDDGVGHGGTTVLHGVCRPSPATARPSRASNRTTATKRTTLHDLGGLRRSDEVRPRQRPWRQSGESAPTAAQSEQQLT